MLRRILALPDGRVFMVANNQTIIYDIEANTETILPDIPNNVRVTNPIDGSAILLPLSPAKFFLLSDREKEIARARIMADSSAVVGEKLNIRDAFRPFKDPMYW